ncbi:MAG TPA: HAMP domain-containing sensor histidine kinase [Gaiellaceae bacterium]|nr:HAMP domain-containing sensor histidine kinase [Gaiellaceae bacterium]
MRTSLRTRLFQAIAVIVLLCVGMTIGLGLFLTRRAVDQATLKDVEHQAALIAAREEAAVDAYTDLVQVAPVLKQQHQRYIVSDVAFLPASAISRLADHKPASGTVEYQGTRYYYAAEPAVQQKTFVLLRPTSSTSSRWTPYVFGLLIAAGVGGVLAAAAAFLLARRIARPVGHVADAARSLARGTHPEPVPVEGVSEIATLAVAFNDLAAQLQRAQEAERNFLLSVSHELKTPLTSIRGYTEAVEDGAVDPREAAATVALEAARLERLVRDLLDLARMNRTDFSVHNSEIDLAEVAEDAVRRYQPQADQFGVTLAAVAEGPAPAVADADRVLQVVSNLVENALRLTPAGGEVRVAVAPGVLRVEDTGPGIADEDRAHAFERFYLHDRYGRERRVGTGLGLAIVKELTHAMGGSVELDGGAGVGTAFTVRLPVPAPARVPA